MRRLSIATKAMITALVISTFMALAQIGGLAWLVRARFPEAWAAGALASEEHAAFVAGVVVIFALTYGFAGLSAFLWTRRVIRLRITRLMRALDRIAKGDLRSELEPSIDTDLVVMHQAVRKMQDALDALTSELKDVDAQRRRLFADLTHELATPTGTILAIASSLAEPAALADPADRARHAELLEKEAGRLERLIGDMRDLARFDDPDLAFERERTDLVEVAREVAARAPLLAGSGAAIEVRGEEAWAEVDRLRLEQALGNLVGNARRYTKPDGHVVIALTREAEGLRLTVDDDGIGVPDEMLPRLGERLLRLDPSRSAKTGGHGLGLAIVRAIVQRHGGTLRFARAPIGGLRAEIVLPT